MWNNTLSSWVFPTMKSQGAAKNEANNAAQSGAAAPAEAEKQLRRLIFPK